MLIELEEVKTGTELLGAGGGVLVLPLPPPPPQPPSSSTAAMFSNPIEKLVVLQRLAMNNPHLLHLIQLLSNRISQKKQD